MDWLRGIKAAEIDEWWLVAEPLVARAIERAPAVAARIREAVNANPRLAPTTQFNDLAGLAGAGAAAGAVGFAALVPEQEVVEV